MPKRNLTAQNAFIGVREDVSSINTAPTGTEAQISLNDKEIPGEIDLRAIKAAAITEQQDAQDKLTLYLSPVIRTKLDEAWQTVRHETGIKIGKSSIVLQALTLVLEKPDLLTKVLTETVRDRATTVR